MSSKLFYSIREVSEYSGVPPYTIRYWEKKFNLLRPEKDSRGRRRYTKKDMELVNRIKNLIYEEKYRVEGVKKRIKEDKKKSPEEIEDILTLMRKELESILEVVSR
ncbi:MAG TPA: MerR family transcriptional regulator [Candidatus Omnitrophica bacterium]|nr:MerR family transcriptional regulator [Candidatus Omnitrophota bacterium]